MKKENNKKQSKIVRIVTTNVDKVVPEHEKKEDTEIPQIGTTIGALRDCHIDLRMKADNVGAGQILLESDDVGNGKYHNPIAFIGDQIGNTNNPMDAVLDNAVYRYHEVEHLLDKSALRFETLDSISNASYVYLTNIMYQMINKCLYMTLSSSIFNNNSSLLDLYIKRVTSTVFYDAYCRPTGTRYDESITEIIKSGCYNASMQLILRNKYLEDRDEFHVYINAQAIPQMSITLSNTLGQAFNAIAFILAKTMFVDMPNCDDIVNLEDDNYALWSVMRHSGACYIDFNTIYSMFQAVMYGFMNPCIAILDMEISRQTEMCCAILNDTIFKVNKSNKPQIKYTDSSSF